MEQRPPEPDELREATLLALRGVMDPEVGINIVDLGLVYGVEVEGGRARVRLTMTSAACPLGEEIAAEAEARVRSVPGIDDVTVDLVWDPPWSPERMTPAARQALGWST